MDSSAFIKKRKQKTKTKEKKYVQHYGKAIVSSFGPVSFTDRTASEDASSYQQQ